MVLLSALALNNNQAEIMYSKQLLVQFMTFWQFSADFIVEKSPFAVY